jgi:hypothetical protein
MSFPHQDMSTLCISPPLTPLIIIIPSQRLQRDNSCSSPDQRDSQQETVASLALHSDTKQKLSSLTFLHLFCSGRKRVKRDSPNSHSSKISRERDSKPSQVKPS